MDIFTSHYYKIYQTTYKIIGHWPYQAQNERVLINVVHICLGIPVLLLQFEFIYTHLGILDDLMTNSSFIVAHIFLYFMCTNYYIQRSTLTKLHDAIRSDWELTEHPAELKVLHKNTSFAKKLLLLNTGATSVLVLVFYIVPLVPIVLNIVKPLDEPRLVLYVLEIDLSPYLMHNTFLVYTYNAICITACISYFQVLYNTCVMLTFHNCATFTITRIRLEQIAIKCEGRRNCDRIVFNDIKSCVRRHCKSLSFTVWMEKYLRFIFTIGLILNTAQTSAQIYAVILTFENSNDVPKLIGMAIAIFLGVFIYCFLGEQIIQNSSQINNFCYKTSWYLWPPKLRRMLNMMQCQCNKVCKINVIGHMGVSLEECLKMLQTSFSFFTVLWSVRK